MVIKWKNECRRRRRRKKRSEAYVSSNEKEPVTPLLWFSWHRLLRAIRRERERERETGKTRKRERGWASYIYIYIYPSALRTVFPVQAYIYRIASNTTRKKEVLDDCADIRRSFTRVAVAVTYSKKNFFSISAWIISLNYNLEVYTDSSCTHLLRIIFYLAFKYIFSISLLQNRAAA